MKRFIILALCAIVAGFITSCEKKDVSTEIETVTQEISKEIKLQLEAIGVNAKDAKIQTRTLLDGSKVTGVRSGDYFSTIKDLMDTPVLGVAEGNTKQYRTNNLVSGSYRTIDIIGYTGGGGFGLNSKERTGLQWAVNNYNRLNLAISFRLTFGTDYQSKDMVVYHDPNEEAAGEQGGVAGFPDAQGRPNFGIAIYGLSAYSNNVNEHVITHEIGHSIGFRHTDWFSRQSCGQSGESAGSDGAILIPGTPSGYDATSIMLACFSTAATGEFNSNDTTALNYLY
ncbi:M57 family metalloprotease [Aquimarina sp. 2201CG14-23]|uniref:M57 family metalloprotease n=1 Tax=Aquimarina mycalae TaxID=3040073 RepID=UPI00247829C7|nr:M57 family metalloprotease [Aquimarina sp. 2201CG14-23]MDH7444706.1 M57 family metalloprotease [Aquimarina sp. 2201CG14-23]